MNQNDTNTEIYNGIEELELLDAANNYTYSIIKSINSYFNSRKVTLDFGAGAGTYAKRMRDQNFSIDCVEIDPTLTKLLKFITGLQF
jgi:16S rRNA A1518/A1519 N6-dimethyltransferase RsmA/KsgA/DIM1 with predicted DNA glycosylase/AP lyase activity